VQDLHEATEESILFQVALAECSQYC
jgi:hypothetical protein